MQGWDIYRLPNQTGRRNLALGAAKPDDRAVNCGCGGRTMVVSSETAGVPHDIAEAILGKASDAVIATDHGGLITFWNPGAARIFGFTAQEAVGRSLDLIIPDNLRARHW